jgi:hypothetical protein
MFWPSQMNLPAFQLSLAKLFHRQTVYLILLSFSVFLLFCVAFYPGVMIVDSYSQYYEALRFYFFDWHPPAMAALWALTDRVIQGPGGMFLLQIGAAVLSVFLLARAAAVKCIKLYFAPVFLLFIPSISCFLFAVMKDVNFAVSLLLAFSLWYFWTTSGKLNHFRLFVIMALVFYASCIRHNAVPATLPLIALFLSATQNSRKKVIFLSLSVMGLFFLGNYILTYRVLRANRVYISQTVMAHDLMGIYVITRKNYFPENYLSKDKVDSLASKFDPSNNLFTTQLLYDSQAISDLKGQWLLAILEHPATYLSNRWKLFRSFLFEIEWIIAPVSHPPFKELQNVSRLAKETYLGRTHTRYVTWVHENASFVFNAATYLFASFVILIFSIRKKILSSAALSLSSVLYIGHYFFVASIVNYRKTYWATVATFLSLFVLWIELDGSAKERLDTQHA